MVDVTDTTGRTFGASRPRLSETQTASLPERAEEQHAFAASREKAPLPRKETAPRIDESEKGREDALDSFDRLRPAAPPDREATGGNWATVRSALAKELLVLIDPMEATLGQVSCATHVQILKRQLARCHVELDSAKSETDFLSILALIESSLAQLTWKQYTPERLAAVRQALQLAYEKPHISSDDYQAIRRAFRGEHIETAPTIDVASLDLEGWDEEEIDAP